MATTLALNQIIQYRVFCVLGSQVSVNVRYGKITAVVGAPTDLDAVTAIDAVMAPLYKPLVTAAGSYYGVSAQIVSMVPKPIPQVTAVSSGAGSAGANACPSQDCGLLTLKTASSGPGFRGRVYLPFLATGSLASTGFTSGAYQSAAASLAAAFVGPLFIGSGGNTATMTAVLYKRASGTSIPLLTYVIHTGVATMKKRGAFGRTNSLPF